MDEKIFSYKDDYPCIYEGMKFFPLDEVAEFIEYQNFILIVFKSYDAQFLMKKHFKKEELEQIMLKLKK